MDIDTIFTRGAVQHLGGPRFFERGASYAASGRVKKLKLGDDAVTATVRGQHPYQVRLWVEDGGPAYSCTCPVGEDGLFCKHCVAVGLAFASRDEEPTTPGIAGDDAVTVDLRSYLHTQAKEKLVELILEQARDDEFLRGRLLLEAAKKRGARIDLDEFREAIESVINVGEFVDYRSMYAYSSGIQEVVDSVETLLKEGHAAEVVELAEHTLTCLEDALGRVDDSDGCMAASKTESASFTMRRAPPLTPIRSSSRKGCSSGSCTQSGRPSTEQRRRMQTCLATRVSPFIAGSPRRCGRRFRPSRHETSGIARTRASASISPT